MSLPIDAAPQEKPAAAEPLKPFHWRIAALASLAFGGNGIDLGVISFALPGVQREWDLTPADLGALLPAVILGQAVGAIVGGSLADRFGRRFAFCASSALAGAGTGLAGLAPHPFFFALALFFGGVGFGGVGPVGGALISEFSPPSHRGQLMAWTQVAWALGWSVAGVSGGWFASELGWRGILAVGAFPILIGILGWLATPESPRFLLAKGRRDDALALARKLQARHGITASIGEPAPHAGPSRPWARVAELWSPVFRQRTVALWMTWLALMAGFAGPVIWLPIILADVDPGAAPRISALVGFSMLPAAFVALPLIDRWGRRPLILVSLGAAGAGSLCIAFAENNLLIVLGAVALAAGLLAAWPVMLAWSSEQYPTRMRGTAAGCASGFGRLAAMGAPLVLGVLLEPAHGGRATAMLPFTVLLISAAASIGLFAQETAGRTLEELSR